LKVESKTQNQNGQNEEESKMPEAFDFDPNKEK